MQDERLNAPLHEDPKYGWYLIRLSGVEEQDRVHDLSKDGEAERLASADVLGEELVQLPLTNTEVERVRAFPGREVHPGGYAHATSYSPGLKLSAIPEMWPCYTGAGVTVSVLDTGLDASYHGYFASVTGESFVAGEHWNSDKVSGHGSHCAGTVGANRSVGGLQVGVAPDVSILAYKVLGDSGSGSYAGIIRGLERAVSQGVQVINLSLGGPGDADHPLSMAVDAASRSAVVVVAAGNEQSGQTAYMADQSTPASAREAVTVGAVDSSGHRASFSNIGTSLDIAAHGVNVPSLTGNSSGTSMSAPHVSGVAALLCQTGRSPAEIRQALLSGARNTSLTTVEEGFGILSAPGAMERLIGTPATSKNLAAHMSKAMTEAWQSWKRRERV